MSMSVLTANVCIITKPTVTNIHRPVRAYRKLPEFAIKLQKQKLFKRVDHNETYYTISERTDELFIFLNSK